MNFLTNINLNQNELQNFILQELATAPQNPKEGQIYENTTTHRAYRYNGTEWIPMDSVDATMSGSAIVSAINGSSSKIDDDNLSSGVNTAVADAHTHSNKSVLDATTASYTTAEKTKLSGIETGADVTDAGNVGAAVNGTTAKATPVDADAVPLLNSASSNALAKTTWANIKATLKSYFDGLYNKYVHPNHTGDVTSAGDGATTIAAGAVTNAKLAAVATGTLKGRASTGSGDVEDLTAAQVRSILNVADGANNYVHPTGDGNLHVPATGTTHSGQVLTAGSTAGSLSWAAPAVSWGNVSGKPSSSASAIDSAVSEAHTHSNKSLLDSYTQTNANLADATAKKHSQNTDIGTDKLTFEIGFGDYVNGIMLVASSTEAGTLELQSEIKSGGLADLNVNNLHVDGDLTVAGDVTQINKNEVNIGDNEIVLNADITASNQNSDGGISVKRLRPDGSTGDFPRLFYRESDGRWYVSNIVNNTAVGGRIPAKMTQTIGDGTETEFYIQHDFNTKDITVSIRDTLTDEQVFTDVKCDLDGVTISFATPPGVSQYAVTVIG